MTIRGQNIWLSSYSCSVLCCASTVPGEHCWQTSGLLHAASRVDPIGSSPTGVYLGFGGTFTAAGKVINGRSHNRKNSHAKATDSGVRINTEIERMCNFVKPNQYQCISTNE